MYVDESKRGMLASEWKKIGKSMREIPPLHLKTATWRVINLRELPA